MSDVGRTYPSRAKTFRADEWIKNSVDADEIPTDEYEVSRLVDICFGDPNETGKRGLNFKVKDVLSFPVKHHLVTVSANYAFALSLQLKSFSLLPLGACGAQT